MFRSKQIINEEYHYIPIEGGLELYLFCPEKDSFLDKYSNKGTKNRKRFLISHFSAELKFEFVAIDPEFGEITIPKKSKFRILKYSRVSSILDGETFDEIPFYKIPFTHDYSVNGENWDSHKDINIWERAYARIEELWYNDNVAEKWSSNQLQNFKSNLNQAGIACSKRIEEVTGVPTYYFLKNWRAWGREKDKKRKCPKCDGNWLIEGRTFNDTVAFKCDNCRLVSELSSNK